MLSEFYHLRRTAIKDVFAYLGFLAGFIGAAPFAWTLLGDQLASGAFVKGLWYFFGIVVAAGIFTGVVGLGLGVVAGILWESFHRHRRKEHVEPSTVIDAANRVDDDDENANLDGPRLRLVRDGEQRQMKAKAIIIFLLVAAPFPMSAQSAGALLGSWKGTSKCLVRPSACHDEIAVYYITRLSSDTTKFQVRADKIVNGVEEDMGILAPCTFNAKTSLLICGMPANARPGEWRFTLHGNSLDGGLWIPGGAKFREVHVKRTS